MFIQIQKKSQGFLMKVDIRGDEKIKPSEKGELHISLVVNLS